MSSSSLSRRTCRAMEDEKLIEAVKTYPCLWNTTAASYRDVKAKDMAWKQVATQIGESGYVGKCIKRWKNIRDRFVRELKKTKQNIGEEGDSSYTPSWPLFSKLLFLQDIVRHRLNQGSFSASLISEPSTAENQMDGGSDDEDSINTCDINVSSEAGSRNDVIHPMGNPSKKQKRNNHKEDSSILTRTLVDQEDEEELYGRQLAATLRRLSGRQKAYAKMQIQKVLLEIEYPETEKSPPVNIEE